MLLTCGECRTSYAFGAPRCPHCGSVKTNKMNYPGAPVVQTVGDRVIKAKGKGKARGDYTTAPVGREHDADATDGLS